MIDQVPSPGTVVVPGAAVEIRVAVPIQVEVPALTGRRQPDAVAIVGGVRLRVGQIREKESDDPRGVVVDQAPQSGERVNVNTAVDLWIATPRRIIVPDLRRASRQQAGGMLRAAGLALGDVREEPARAPRGTVVTQRPAPGSVVEAGTSVSLVVAAPPPQPPPVPPTPPAPAPPPAVPARRTASWSVVGTGPQSSAVRSTSDTASCAAGASFVAAARTGARAARHGLFRRNWRRRG